MGKVLKIQDITNKATRSKLCAKFGHIQSGWRTIGGIKYFFRSKWESNYAKYLEWLKHNGSIKDWLHECETFWFHEIKRGVRSYLPDFKIIKLDGSHEWHEVKGYYDSKSLTKIKRMGKYYPHEKLVLIDKTFFNKNSSKLKILIKDWE